MTWVTCFLDSLCRIMTLLHVRQIKCGSSDEQTVSEPVAVDSYEVVTETDGYNDGGVQHLACWRLDQRGAVGETALHLCMLYSKLPEFRAISFALLDLFPTLSVDYYEGDEYYGKFFAGENLAVAAAIPKSHSEGPHRCMLSCGPSVYPFA